MTITFVDIQDNKQNQQQNHPHPIPKKHQTLEENDKDSCNQLTSNTDQIFDYTLSCSLWLQSFIGSAVRARGVGLEHREGA